MASKWRYSATLVGTNNLKTTLNFIIPSSAVAIGDGFNDAYGKMGDVKADLENLTDAVFSNEGLTLLVGGDVSLPADADITDEAVIVTFLTGAGVQPKYHPIRIPAPVDSLFETDGLTVDEANADLQSYVQTLSDSVEVSDGEAIDTEVDNGIAFGFWRSVKKSGRKGQ